MDSSNHDDAVAVYLSEIGSVQPLSKEEEAALFQQLAKPSDWGSRELVTRKLIEAHLSQVVDIARNHPALGVPLLDLIQEGNLGLMNAIKSFADNPVGDFSDHAAVCIEDAINKAFR